MVATTSGDDHSKNIGEADEDMELDFTCELPPGWETSFLNKVISCSSGSDTIPVEARRQLGNSISWDDAFSRTPPTGLVSNCMVYARPVSGVLDMVFISADMEYLAQREILFKANKKRRPRFNLLVGQSTALNLLDPVDFRFARPTNASQVASTKDAPLYSLGQCLIDF